MPCPHFAANWTWEQTGLHREASSDSWWLQLRQTSLLLLQLGGMVAPGRGTEQPSGSGNALDVLAEPQSSSVRACSSDEVAPLSLLGAAVLAQTSSLPHLCLTAGLGAGTHRRVTPGQPPLCTSLLGLQRSDISLWCQCFPVQGHSVPCLGMSSLPFSRPLCA